MGYTACKQPGCGCECPSCGERGDLCTCSQAEHDLQRSKRLAGLPARYETTHEAWSPAQAWQHAG